MSEAKEILLLRHGKTPGNALRQYIGSTDESLSPEGRAELAVFQYTPEKAVYISPMLRCRETAELLFPGAELISVDDLREMDFGHFEGRSYLDMAEDAEYLAWLETNCESPVPGGESKADFTERCCAAFEKILAADGSDRLVFVVHGGTIMAIMERFALPQRGFYAYLMSNGGGYTCDVRWTAQGLPILQNVKEVRHEAKFI